MQKLKIIVGGYIGLYPTGGATLDYIQYPLGLKLLGHDVYYIEDTMQYPIYQENGKAWNDASACVAFLKETMDHFGLAGKWAYRDIASGECFGLRLKQVYDICSTADIFINISCSTFMRDEYFKIPNRILIDSDPMFTQVTYFDELNGNTTTSVKKLIETHNYLFSFGENIGKDDCQVPTFNLDWISTRQPVCLQLWNRAVTGAEKSFTSIMNWSGRRKMLYNNEEWGQKDIEFEKFVSVPKKLPEINFKVVINPPLHPDSNFNLNELTANKWQVIHPKDSVADHHAYVQFIKNSFAEFSVAKETYVKSRSGWFSCRSACYLAAGKPVVAQETGWSKYIPAGNGLFAFDDTPSAIEAIRAIAGDRNKHAKAAVEIANQYFDSTIVLTDLINKLN